jgi:hypothetical protein
MPLKRFGPGALALLVLALVGAVFWWRTVSTPHNVIIFVSDGLRSGIVTPQSAPALAAVRAEGVDFRDSHSLFPTVTTPNASAIATGHGLGDTGDFANIVYAGAPPLTASFTSQVAGLEDDPTQEEMTQRFGGNYLHETSLLAAARAAGFSTAAIGKLGPVGVQDVNARRDGTIIIDDASGTADGVPLASDIVKAIKALGLEWPTPDRGLNTDPGDFIRPGVHVANVEQQTWFARIATEVLLPRFKAAHRPFVMVFWSRDPDGTQHNQGDSLNTLTPGINGPTTMAAIRNASDDLQRLRDALKRLGLDKTTDIITTADHGFSTMSRQSATSGAAKTSYRDVPKGFLPPGFLAIDLAQALSLPLHEPNGLDVELKDGFHPRHANAVLGADPAHPDVVIGANGGVDVIWLPRPDKALAARIVQALTGEDYTGGVFVRDDLGPIAGALPTSVIGLKGAAVTPRPAILVSFRSYALGCPVPDTCGVEVADSDLQQGQGIHGAFSRADTHNFIAASGPDFKSGFVDPLPVSNADITASLETILGLHVHSEGPLRGRVLVEALKNRSATGLAETRTIRSQPAANGFQTILNLQAVGDETYFDSAGAPGRTLGLKP